ncbi:hypothetical protein CISG_09766 [Coccidioides immitis RMSCC 3703]|uniref:Uncharacterized protein n=1 Tax=Coccidioides immitis RMSCC 3703 TaxID=454286 RepID=A0A0J8QN83_COCIT|nr:hypothetical protein CISG_09766 [Coccidioides immitis RMSCC 3703]
MTIVNFPAATEYSPVDTKVAESGLVCIVHPSCRSRCNPEVTGSVIFGLHGETHGSLYQALSILQMKSELFGYPASGLPTGDCAQKAGGSVSIPRHYEALAWLSNDDHHPKLQKSMSG